MKTKYIKLLVAFVAAAFVCASVPALAVTVTFGGQPMNAAAGNPLGDGSGLSSPVGVNANNTAKPYYFIETFDGTHTNGTVGLTNGGTVTVESGGWFTSLNEATDLYVSGSFGIRTGTVSYAAQPGGTNPLIQDTTNFAYAPGQNQSLPVTVRVEYATDLATYLLGYKISYLGLYYGSIDNYNNIAFYSGGVNSSNPFIGAGILSDGVISGAEILASQGGTSGNQYQVGSNVYVNLAFSPNEVFTAFELRTTGVAFEVDNIVVGISPIPEPATMLLLGLGLVGLAGIRRKI